MGRKMSALVVTIDEAAEMLIAKTSFIKREIRDGAIRAIRLGNQTVVRKDELKAYLERKEAEGIPTKRPRKGQGTGSELEDPEDETQNSFDEQLQQNDEDLSANLPKDDEKE